MSDPNRNPAHPLRAALGRTPECPPLEALAAPAPAAPLQAHLESCPHCRAELSLLRAFENAEARPEETADLAWIESELVRHSTRSAPQPQPLAARLRAWAAVLFTPVGHSRLAMAAAAMLVLLAVGVFVRQRGAAPAPSSDDATVWRSARIAAVAPIGDLDRPPSQFRWEPAPAAASYRLRLLEIDGTEIWSAESPVPLVEIPDSLAPKLIAGRAFQWEVAARDSRGRPVASTSLQSFHILATPR